VTQIALRMLRQAPERIIADARKGAQVNNSVIGSLISLQYRVPRWAAERAVREALAIIDAKEKDDEDKSTR